MKKLFYILFLLPMVSLAQVKVAKDSRITVYNTSQPGPITGTEFGSNFRFGPLPSTMLTSAGVYKNGILIRTLWSMIPYSSGYHDSSWDGRDNDGGIVPNADYEIKVQWNDIKSFWNHPIGNSSDSATGESVHRSPEGILDVSFINNWMMIAKGGSEGTPSHDRTDARWPNRTKQVIKINNSLGTGIGSQCVTSDNTRTYWAGVDDWATKQPANGPNYAHSAIWATDTLKNQVIFANGQPFKTAIGSTYSSAFGIKSTVVTGFSAGAKDSALKLVTPYSSAAMRSGNYLFVSYKNANQLQVFNKNTAAFVRTISTTAVGAIVMDRYDNLWLVDNNVIYKHPINSDGTLGTASVVIISVGEPLAMDVTYDNSTLLVCDGSTSQVIGLDNATGDELWTLGQGDYSGTSLVSNDRFYWKDIRKQYPVFVRAAPDGSFWVADPGNDRTQHFAADRSYIDNIAYLGHVYCVGLDANDSTRLFLNYLEYKIDYTKEIKPGNGSWTLTHNHGYNVTAETYSNYDQIRSVATLSNGKTYAITRSGKSNFDSVRTVVELLPNAQPRQTGLNFGGGNFLRKDGGLWEVVWGPDPQQLTKRNLTGFSAGNPVWSATKSVVYSIPKTLGDPIYRGNLIKLFSGEVSENGVYVTATGDPASGTDYHLGFIKDGKYFAKTDRATARTYTGNFPKGAFDEGHGVNYAAAWPMVAGNIAIRAYHGEFYILNGQAQVNKYDLFNTETGLLLNQFGVTRSESLGYAAYQMAGNGFCPAITKIGDTVVVFNGDEDHHGAAQSWYFTNTGSVQVQSIFTSSPSRAKKAETFIDLHDGLVRGTPLKNGTAGWTREPEGDGANFSVPLGNKSWDRFGSVDVWGDFRNTKTSGSSYIWRALPDTSDPSSWTLWGEVSLAWFQNLTQSGAYLEVLDDAGNVLVRLYDSTNSYGSGSHTIWVYANGQVITSAPKDTIQNKLRLHQPFSIRVSSGIARITYADYAPINVAVLAGNWQRPRKIQLRYTRGASGGDLGRTLGVDKLKIKYERN